MSYQSAAWAWAHRELPPAQRLTLLALVDHINADDECWPSVRRLVSDTNLSARTVARSLLDLEAAGLITHEHRFRDDGSQTSSRYLINLGVEPPPKHPITARRAATVSPSTAMVADPPHATVAGGTAPVAEQNPVHRTLYRDEPGGGAAIAAAAPRPTLKAVKPAKLRAPLTGSQRAKLYETFADRWSIAEIDERIDEALNHQAVRKVAAEYPYVRSWLRRDATENAPTVMRNGGPHGTPIRQLRPGESLEDIRGYGAQS